jgi:hypothetical protein
MEEVLYNNLHYLSQLLKHKYYKTDPIDRRAQYALPAVQSSTSHTQQAGKPYVYVGT